MSQRALEERLARGRLFLRDLTTTQLLSDIVSASDKLWQDRALLTSTRLSSEGIAFGLERTLIKRESASALEAASTFSSVPAAAVILPSNVDTAGYAPVLASLLRRVPTLFRVSRRGAGMVPDFLSRLALVDQRYADAVFMHAGTFDDALSVAHEVVVYGSDDTVRTVQELAGPHKVIGHGHGHGVAFVTDSESMSLQAERLAEDTVAYDQRGCRSPLICCTITDDDGWHHSFFEELGDVMADFSRNVPRGLLSPTELAQETTWRQTAASVSELYVEAPTHALASQLPLLSVGYRNLAVVNEASLERALARWASGPIKVVGVPSSLVQPVELQLPQRQVAAEVCELGYMQRPILLDSVREVFGDAHNRAGINSNMS